jgi:single-strand DNA-binding protein
MEQFAQFENKIYNGYLSADPEIKFFDSGSSITKFSIPLKNNKDDEAVWLNCEAWGKTGEEIANTYSKGDQITVIGKFKKETYQDKEYTKFNVSKAF